MLLPLPSTAPRAANGVVIITTKKGQKGRNNVSVRVLQGVASRGLPEYDRLDAFQYYPIMWEAYRNSLLYPATGTGISLDSANRVATGLTSRSSIKDLLAYNPFNVAANTIVGTGGKINPNAKLIYGDDLDWTKDLMRKGSRKDYSVNFSGGADKSDYFMSAGYVKENGYTLKTDFERYTNPAQRKRAAENMVKNRPQHFRQFLRVEPGQRRWKHQLCQSVFLFPQRGAYLSGVPAQHDHRRIRT